MAYLPDSARELIDTDALAHLVTLNEDGSPQVSIVWVGIDGDEIVCAHLPRNRKVRNIERDGRVALSIETDELNDMGLRKYLVVYGTARIVEGGAPELLNHLAQTYFGEGSDFPPMPDPPRATSRGSRSTGSRASAPGLTDAAGSGAEGRHRLSRWSDCVDPGDRLARVEELGRRREVVDHDAEVLQPLHGRARDPNQPA